MSVQTASEFLNVVESSQLLSPAQLSEISAAAPGDATLAAGMLQERGWITAWQAEQMLAGRSQFILGRYKLQSLIGRGAMGAVYKAEHLKMNRTVALKVMAKEILRDPKAIARFQREIRSAGALNHPHIVTALDADCVNDTYFLVMEFVEGEDLKTWRRRHGQAPIDWGCECIRQAALGLQHAFERGMVHRDIKPGNLLVTKGPAGAPLIKILDMGLSRFASEAGTAHDAGLTKTGQVMGTPDYIAPEQARDARSADIRADIFSLGCTLFELLAGRLPFTGKNIMEKLMARALHDAPRLVTLRSEVPAELDAAVARALAREPADRFQTPAELAAALAPFSLFREAPSAPASSHPAPTWIAPAAGGTLADRSDRTRTDRIPGEMFGDLEERARPISSASSTATGVPIFKSRQMRRWIIGGLTICAMTIALVFAWPGAQPASMTETAAVADLKETKSPSVPARRESPPQTAKPPKDLSTNLLKRLDLDRGYVSGLWRLENGVLISPPEQASRLSLGISPPAEYDVRIVAKRVGAAEAFVVGLIAPHGEFVVAIDGWRGTASGLQMLDQLKGDRNETTWKSPVFVEGQPTTIVINVRESAVKVIANGTPIIDFRGDLSRLQPDRTWTVPGGKSLFLGNWIATYEISELTLIPQGKQAAAEALKSSVPAS